jgi:hypothetical protein
MAHGSFAATRTCDECPWRKDVPPGRFPPARFERLRSTVEQGIDKPLFACHKTREGREVVCVGYLLCPASRDNFRVRLALWREEFDPAKLVAAGPLFRTYGAMERANRRRPRT